MIVKFSTFLLSKGFVAKANQIFGLKECKAVLFNFYFYLQHLGPIKVSGSEDNRTQGPLQGSYSSFRQVVFDFYVKGGQFSNTLIQQAIACKNSPIPLSFNANFIYLPLLYVSLVELFLKIDNARKVRTKTLPLVT